MRQIVAVLALMVTASLLGGCVYNPYTGAYQPCCGYYPYPYSYPYGYRYPPPSYTPYGTVPAPYGTPPQAQPGAYPSGPPAAYPSTPSEAYPSAPPGPGAAAGAPATT